MQGEDRTSRSTISRSFSPDSTRNAIRMKGRQRSPLMKLSAFSPKQLIEIDACTRCGECLKYCPVYEQRGEEEIDPRGKIQTLKAFIRSQYGVWARIFGPKKLDEEKLKKFSEMVYRW